MSNFSVSDLGVAHVNFDMNSRHGETLLSFIRYCMAHPNERFWQALRNWSGSGFICADEFDTFYWEGRTAVQASYKRKIQRMARNYEERREK